MGGMGGTWIEGQLNRFSGSDIEHLSGYKTLAAKINSLNDDKG